MSHSSDNTNKKLKQDKLEAAAKKTAVNSSIRKDIRKLNARKVKTVSTNKQKQKDLMLIEDCLPQVLSESMSLSKKISVELKRHHRWFAVVFFYCDRFPRVLRVMSLATNIIIMLFVQSVTYTLTNPDDGSCELLRDQPSCLVPRSPYATGQSKCAWSGPASGTQSGTCTYIDPGSSMQIILFVAVFSAIVSTPLALVADWIIQNVLSATTETSTNKVVAANTNHRLSDLVPVATGKRNAMWSALSHSSGNQLALKIQAQAEIRTLSHELRNYRKELSETQKIEFDCKFVILFAFNFKPTFSSCSIVGPGFNRTFPVA
jgi:hypothetical protein